jgi:hypothetical protein
MLHESDICAAIPYTVFRNCEKDEFHMQGSGHSLVYGDKP